MEILDIAVPSTQGFVIGTKSWLLAVSLRWPVGWAFVSAVVAFNLLLIPGVVE